MDRDRIRAGVAVTKEITAARKSEALAEKIRSNNVTKDDIRQYGPIFVYNGIPAENEAFQLAIQSPLCLLPQEKVVIIDQVTDSDGTAHPIRHTGDQIKSLFDAIQNAQHPLYGVENMALVAHIPDFARNPFYTEKYNQDHVAAGGKEVNFWIYALKSRPDAEEYHLPAELARLKPYADKGDLATIPSQFST